MSLLDDPREILKAAGVECAEVEKYLRVKDEDAKMWEGWNATNDAGHECILALARLVAKYKWQRDGCARNLDAFPLTRDWRTGSFFTDHIADLDARWKARPK